MNAAPIPRYQHLANDLTSRIAKGALAPGEMLPSEHDLGRDYGVSQGTARRALSLLEARGLLERRQGRGTFVARATEERALFHFFRLRDAKGGTVIPQLVEQRLARRRASAAEMRAFGARNAVQIDRLRLIGGRRAARERVILPLPAFASLLAPDAEAPPNALYPFYQRAFGITVAQADERLAPLACPEDGHEGLETRRGAALLRVEREARDPSGTVVELRRCLYAVDGLHYHVALR